MRPPPREEGRIIMLALEMDYGCCVGYSWTPRAAMGKVLFVLTSAGGLSRYDTGVFALVECAERVTAAPCTEHTA